MRSILKMIKNIIILISKSSLSDPKYKNLQKLKQIE